MDGMRRATTADVAAIRDVVGRAYEKYADRMDRPPAPVGRDYASAVEAGVVWVLGAPVHAVVSLIDLPDALLIENAAVDPLRQGHGLGRLLMQFAEAEAVRRGFGRVKLYTNEAMTENLSIYHHLGYTEVRRSEEDGYRRVFMEKAVAKR